MGLQDFCFCVVFLNLGGGGDLWVLGRRSGDGADGGSPPGRTGQGQAGWQEGHRGKGPGGLMSLACKLAGPASIYTAVFDVTKLATLQVCGWLA